MSNSYSRAGEQEGIDLKLFSGYADEEQLTDQLQLSTEFILARAGRALGTLSKTSLSFCCFSLVGSKDFCERCFGEILHLQTPVWLQAVSSGLPAQWLWWWFRIVLH